MSRYKRGQNKKDVRDRSVATLMIRFRVIAIYCLSWYNEEQVIFM